jgi:hypothetical protein
LAKCMKLVNPPSTLLPQKDWNGMGTSAAEDTKRLEKKKWNDRAPSCECTIFHHSYSAAPRSMKSIYSATEIPTVSLRISNKYGSLTDFSAWYIFYWLGLWSFHMYPQLWVRKQFGANKKCGRSLLQIAMQMNADIVERRRGNGHQWSSDCCNDMILSIRNLYLCVTSLTASFFFIVALCHHTSVYQVRCQRQRGQSHHLVRDVSRLIVMVNRFDRRRNTTKDIVQSKCDTQ